MSCIPCWYVASYWTQQYLTWNGEPCTTVGLYRERHAEHAARVAKGLPWSDDAGLWQVRKRLESEGDNGSRTDPAAR
jgi:hypothetical protein